MWWWSAYTWKIGAHNTSKYVEKHRFTVQNYVFCSILYCDIDCDVVEVVSKNLPTCRNRVFVTTADGPYRREKGSYSHFFGIRVGWVAISAVYPSNSESCVHMWKSSIRDHLRCPISTREGVFWPLFCLPCGIGTHFEVLPFKVDFRVLFQ